MFLDVITVEGLKKTLNVRYVVEIYPNTEPGHTDIKMVDGKVYTMAKGYDTVSRTIKEMTSRTN
jgi:hypothetical protein